MHRTLLGTMLTTLFCAMLLPLNGCGTAETSANFPEAESSVETKICVTLGDSISAGYGLSNPEDTRYSARVTQMLVQADGNDWRDCNYAVSGDDSSDLLQRLEDGRAVRLPSADAIVVCIGANNYLGPYTDYMQAVMQQGEGTAAAAAAFSELTKAVDAGEIRLESDLEILYDWIRAHSSVTESRFYLLNVYNPYADVDAIVPEVNQPLSEYAAGIIDRCNAVLMKFAAAHPDIITVDVAAAFSSCEQVPILGNSLGDSPLLIDPHPNEAGQQIIADTLFAAMEEELQ